MAVKNENIKQNTIKNAFKRYNNEVIKTKKNNKSIEMGFERKGTQYKLQIYS